MLNGGLLVFPVGQEPELREGRVWGPARVVTDALGARVEWRGVTRQVAVWPSGSGSAVEVAGEIRGGRAWAPVADVARACGASVVWDARTRTVRLTV